MKSTVPVPVALGVLRRGNRFLVARRPSGAHQGGTWEFPGGKIKSWETPEDALRREVAEETGMTFREAVLLHIEEYSYPDRSVILYCFLCLDPEEAPQRPGPGASACESCWVTFEELRNLRMPPANKSLVEILGEQFGDER